MDTEYTKMTGQELLNSIDDLASDLYAGYRKPKYLFISYNLLRVLQDQLFYSFRVNVQDVKISTFTTAGGPLEIVAVLKDNFIKVTE